MTARARDAIGIAILLVAAVVVLLAWHPLGPWLSLGIAFASALAVMGVYRARPPRASQASRPHDGRRPALLHQD